jgi:hypothetical protein
MSKKQTNKPTKHAPSRKSISSADDLTKTEGVELSEEELTRVAGGLTLKGNLKY